MAGVMGALAERAHIAWWGWLATVATSLSYLTALEDKRFVLVGGLFAALVFVMGVGLRALRVPAPIVVVVQLVVLAETLLMAFMSGFKYAVVPTGETFASLQRTLQSGADVAQEYAAPAPENTGLMLMVVFAVVMVAIAVDFLGVALRRVPLAGLPLLALYTIPVAALPDGVPFFWFVPGAAAFIAMIAADERDRLAHWGRLVSRDRGVTPQGSLDTAGIVATGRRIAVTAMCAAVILPVFIPAFSSALLDSGRSSGPGDGPGSGPGGEITFEDPMVSLASGLQRGDPVDLLTITSDTLPDYLRLAVIDQPGPTGWTASNDLGATLPASSFLPPPTGLSPEVSRDPYTMVLEPTEAFPDTSPWLPVPFNMQATSLRSDQSYVVRDQTVAAGVDGLAGISSYEVSYASIRPSQDQLIQAGAPPQEIVDAYAAVPPDVPPTVADTARAVTAGAPNQYQQALLLQSFFRGGDFTYDLDVGYGYGYDAMSEFLEQRRGFCQQFAATMAMMARTLGIPSRIVVGFLKPESFDGDNTYVMTSYNLHSWPELYFDGVGWVRFEPTPGNGATVPGYAQLTALLPTGPSGTLAEESTGPSSSRPERTDPLDGGVNTPAAGGDSGSGLPVPPTWVLGAILVLLLALLPAGIRHAVRSSRVRRPGLTDAAVEAAWAELRDHVRDLRMPWSGSMTPRARADSVATLVQADAAALDALRRLTHAVERARYARSIPAEATPGADAETVMSAISHAASRTQRIKAFVLPVSLVPDIEAGWAAFTAGLRRRRSTQ